MRRGSATDPVGLAWGIAACVASASAVAAQESMEVAARAAQTVRCWDERPGGERPNADLYCIDLVPSPDFQQASARAELGWVPTPFGIAVTREGVPLHDITVRVDGLPSPATLGPYTAYMAWATSPAFDTSVVLGQVANGRPATSRVGLEKFLILVSAESSDDGRTREGPLIFRGTSAAMRLPGGEMPFLVSGAYGGSSSDGTHESAVVDESAGKVMNWSLPPMLPDMEMPPAILRHRPKVAPFLPSDSVADRIPVARPREVVEVGDGDTLRLEAGPVLRRILGRSHVMYGFEGQYPGPLLIVEEGATITVEYTNRTPFPSTIHWHGVRLDNHFDGVPNVTQPPVSPGASFRYEVRFPDAGIYWYHPHRRESMAQGLGLYGNIFVEARQPDRLDPVNREEFVMLDDLLVGETGLAPFGLQSPTHALMGRFGNVLLVNGEPIKDLEVRRGEVVRFFLTNAANTRTFNLVFGEADVKVVGSDLGLFERQAWVESVVLAPAERYVVDVRFGSPGRSVVTNRVRAINHRAGVFLPSVDTLIRVTVHDVPATPDHESTFRRLRENREVTEEMGEPEPLLARPVDRTLVLTQDVRGLPYPLGLLLEAGAIYFPPVEWTGSMPLLNWLTTGREVEWILRDPATGKENMEIDWRLEEGETLKIRITNERQVLHAMQHPIHIHGQRFMVLQVNGVPNPNRVWKDTVLLPVGATADILLDASNRGRWMVHCHIAEHLETGMMMLLDVESGRGGGPPDGAEETI